MEIFEAIERRRKQSGVSRSEFLRRAVEFTLVAEAEREAVDQYVTAYREQPEGEEEAAEATSLARAAFGENPWK